MRVQWQFRIGLAVLAFIVALSGSVQAQPLQRLVFATDWLAQAEHGGFYQAIVEGTYAKYGLDVQIRMPVDVLRGQGDLRRIADVSRSRSRVYGARGQG